MIDLHCMVCTRKMPDDRPRKAKTCSAECQRVLNNARRQERAGKVCRLCNRRFGKVKELEPVLSKHNAIAAKVGG